MKKGMIGILALLIVLAIPIASAADSEYYLVPKDSNVSAGGDTVEVELWLDATDPAASGAVRINYTYCCADITSYTADKTFFEDVGIVQTDGQLNIGFAHFDSVTSLPANQPVGSYHLGNLTIECCSGDCMTDLLLVDCELFDWYGYGPAGPLPFVTTNGTFTCGPDREPCLGDCYATYDCTGAPIAIGVPCYVCLGSVPGSTPIGLTWKNYQGPACLDPCNGSKIRCWEYCPECCDGIDNDLDGFVDCDGGPTGGARDPECQCCTDLSETIKDPCGTGTAEPCVPELPTLALAGLGILGIALLARKRD